MLEFTSLNRKICAFNQLFNEGKDGASLRRKAIVMTMFLVIIGANLATAATTAIANSNASSTTIAQRRKPTPPVPPTQPVPPVPPTPSIQTGG